MIKKTIKKNNSDVYIKIHLKSNANNIGFFNVYDNELGVDGDFYIVDGECKSRLSELEKSINTDEFLLKYIQSDSVDYDGVNYSLSNLNNIIYYINGIEYNDNLLNNITTFKMNTNGLNSYNSLNSNIYFNESILESISLPKMSSDIFIERPKFKIVEPFFKISFINNLNELYDVEGGSYYNIIKNE